MDSDSIIIGHYGQRAYTSSSSLLQPLTQDNFNEVIGRVKPWREEIEDYQTYKTTSLPLLFFTHHTSRPKRGDRPYGTGYGVIDIDDGGKYEVEHPAVCCINYTPHGTHLFFHYSGNWGKTEGEWQQTYNSIAYEIWWQLTEKYKKPIRFDGHSSSPYQGTFLWNTEWKGNKCFDRNWYKTERYLPSSVLEEMYIEGTYRDASTENRIEMTEERMEIGEEMKEAFNVLSYGDFLHRYEKDYHLTTGTSPTFKPYTDYQGNTYDMYETKGRHLTLWMPWMRNHREKDGIRIKDFRIEKGGRRRSLWLHLCQVKQYLGSSLTPQQLLYDAVYWLYNFCIDADDYPKGELLEAVHNCLLSTPSDGTNYLRLDSRRFITGDKRWDEERGEEVWMDRGDKIAANARCRKTSRIIQVVKMWNPKKTMDENIEEINSWEEDTLPFLTPRLTLDYLRQAKGMEELTKEYGWLKEMDIDKKTKKQAGKKGGKKGSPKKAITIQNRKTGKLYSFSSKTECMEWLKCSSDTFSRLLKGTSKLSKKYLVIKY